MNKHNFITAKIQNHHNFISLLSWELSPFTLLQISMFEFMDHGSVFYYVYHVCVCVWECICNDNVIPGCVELWDWAHRVNDAVAVPWIETVMVETDEYGDYIALYFITMLQKLVYENNSCRHRTHHHDHQLDERVLQSILQGPSLYRTYTHPHKCK